MNLDGAPGGATQAANPGRSDQSQDLVCLERALWRATWVAKPGRNDQPKGRHELGREARGSHVGNGARENQPAPGAR